MPLLDHFHEPLRARRHWISFHSAWATFIASDLNRRLPKDYVAEPNVKFNIEIDVPTFRDSAIAESLTGGWQPPAPTMTVAFTAVADIVEVQIMDLCGGASLVGAIEIVSPANKDREPRAMRSSRSAPATFKRVSA